MSTSSGGQSGETRYNWNPAIEGLWAGHEGQYEGSILNRANNISLRPYEQFGDPNEYIGNTPGRNRIAALDPYQEDAQRGVYHTIYGGGAPDTEAARELNLRTSQGAFLPGGEYGRYPERVSPERISAIGENPGMWVNSYTGTQTDVEGPNPFGMDGKNPYVGQVKPQSNEFMGDSPYFRSVLQQGRQDITDAYNQGTAADTTRAFNMSGAFGGGAHDRAIERNQNVLGRNLGNFENQMANQQYDRSAGLRESDIGRNLGADQYNAGQGFNAWENQQNRGFQGMQDYANQRLQAGMFDRTLGNQNIENRLNRQQTGFENAAGRDLEAARFNSTQGLGAQQFNSQMGQGAWDSERNRMMQGSQLGMQGQGLSFDAYRELSNAGALNRSLNQGALDLGYGDWGNARNWERGNLGWLANLVSQAQGSTGSTTTFQGYQSNPLSQLAGLGLLGSSMFGR